jgi:hypothetical protein
MVTNNHKRIVRFSSLLMFNVEKEKMQRGVSVTIGTSGQNLFISFVLLVQYSKSFQVEIIDKMCLFFYT